jgi:hypothetical protein
MRKLLFVLTAVVVVLAFTLPAIAQDQSQWSWYGSVKLWTDYERVSKEVPAALSGMAGSAATAWDAGTSGMQDDSEVTWKMPTTALVGANAKWGDITGKFEMAGAAQGYAAVNLRQFWGKWNFSKEGQIEVGQDYTPYFYVTSGMCGPAAADCVAIGYGTMYGGRLPQLRLNYLGFSFALVTPQLANPPSVEAISESEVLDSTLAPVTDSFGNPVYAIVPTGNTSNLDQTLPRIEASYNGNLGPVGFMVGALYQQYKFKYALAGSGEQDTTVTTWLIGAGGKYAMGPFYINAQGAIGRNPMNANIPAFLLTSYMQFDPTTNKSEDAEYWTAQGVIGFKLSDMISFEGGYITQYGKVKDPVDQVDMEQTTGVWYIQATISPAKNFYIIPEVGDIDYKDLKVAGENTKLGDLLYFGIKWQIDF